jgi:glutamine amidotransferase
VYRSTALPVFDRNLSQLAQKLMATSMIAHVRGVAYHPRVTVGEQNLHPFQLADTRLALAHNGDLYQFERMKLALIAHVKPVTAA